MANIAASNSGTGTVQPSFLYRNRVVLSVLGGVFILITIGYFWNEVVTTAVLASSLRQSTPLILGAMCGILCERSGIVNIGIEGTMLMSAFTAFMANVWLSANYYDILAESFANPLIIVLVLALIIGILTGMLFGWLLAFMSVTLRMDQIIGGTVLNILAVGGTGYFYVQNLTTRGKFPEISIPGLVEIPVLGPVFFDNPPLTYLTLILVAVLHFVLYQTVWGLRTRAVGEHPRAADTVGINVFRVRYINVMAGSALAGLAGSYLVLEAVGSFQLGMINGRGFVALAVMLFGKRTPIGSWGAALLFGFATALQTQLQFFGTIDIPHQFIGMLPYVLTILVVAGLVGRTRDPKALAQPYTKE